MANVEKGSKTVWLPEVGRRVAHERHPDGSHIVHINPRGGKATSVNNILRNLSPFSSGRERFVTLVM